MHRFLAAWLRPRDSRAAIRLPGFRGGGGFRPTEHQASWSFQGFRGLGTRQAKRQRAVAVMIVAIPRDPTDDDQEDRTLYMT